MPEKHTKMTHEYEPLPDDSVPGFGDLGLFDAMVHFITGFGVRTVRDSEWSDFDGSSLSKTIKAKASPFKGFTMLVVGTGLSVDGSGQPDAGQISYIQFIDGNANPAGLVNFSEPIQITDFISTAKAGSGKVHASNYKDFFNLVAPGTVTSNGTSESEKFQGNKGDDTFYGKGGNDLFFMFKGNDNINGGKGRDTVDASLVSKAINANLIKGWVKYGTEQASLSGVENVTGSRKDDTITGNSAANVLAGRKGNDKLTGKGGNDKFVFKPNEGTNVITDFQNGKDKLDLKGFKFKSKAAALKHFSEVGSSNDDICKFVFDGTIVKIKGVDLKNIDATDIVI